MTDLQTRIDNAGASLDRVRALLAQAKNIGEVISLESELTQRENTLEELLAQKTYLDSQVAMSTITVHLSATGVARREGRAPRRRASATRSAAAGTGSSAFLGGIVKVIGYTLPFLLLLGLVALIALPISRRVRRNRSAAPPHPPAPVEDRQMSAPGSASFGQKPASSTPSAAHMPSFHGTPRGTSGHSVEAHARAARRRPTRRRTGGPVTSTCWPVT